MLTCYFHYYFFFYILFGSNLEKIQKLKDAIAKEDKIEQETLEYIKNHRPLFVLFRYFLWNLYDIMRHVGHRRIPRLNYPVDYLKLPLLRFESFFSNAVPPEPFEENRKIYFFF